MTIEHVRVVDLTPDQIARCRELSFGEDGYMCEDLDTAIREEKGWKYRYSQTILLTIEDYVVGWALLLPIPHSRRYHVHLFVDQAHRRQGYGSLLLREANRWCKAPVAMIDPENEEFFINHTNLYTEMEYA